MTSNYDVNVVDDLTENATDVTTSDTEDEKAQRYSNVLNKVHVPQSETSKKKRGRPRKLTGKNVRLSSNAKTSAGTALGASPQTLSSSYNATSSDSDLLMQQTLLNLTNELSSMWAVVSDLKETITMAVTKISDLEKENVELRSNLAQKEKTIADLEYKLDDEKQAAKKDTLILTGKCVDSSSANLQDAMEKNVADKLRITPETTAKIKFFKLGQAKNLVAAEIVSHEIRTEMFQAARTIKPNDLFVSESLTKRRRTLLYQLRKLKKSNKIHSAFSYHGNIYYKQTATGDRILVKSLSALQTLVDAYNAEAANDNEMESIEIDF